MSQFVWVSILILFTKTETMNKKLYDVLEFREMNSNTTKRLGMYYHGQHIADVYLTAVFGYGSKHYELYVIGERQCYNYFQLELNDILELASEYLHKTYGAKLIVKKYNNETQTIYESEIPF